MTRARAALLDRSHRKSSRRNFSPMNTSPQSIDFADAADIRIYQWFLARAHFRRRSPVTTQAQRCAMTTRSRVSTSHPVQNFFTELDRKHARRSLRDQKRANQ
jgi:hypothetical protein